MYTSNTNCSRLLRDRNVLKEKWSENHNIGETQQRPKITSSKKAPVRLPRKHNRNRYTKMIIMFKQVYMFCIILLIHICVMQSSKKDYMEKKMVTTNDQVIISIYNY